MLKTKDQLQAIIRIVIKGSSGYCPYDLAYDDKVTVTCESIQYLYKPLCISEEHQPRKWSYRTNRPDFGEMWDELCAMIPVILEQEVEMVLDGGEVTFIVTYEDKLKITKTFWSPSGDPFTACFRLIKKMIPGGEKVPEVLWTEDE